VEVTRAAAPSTAGRAPVNAVLPGICSHDEFPMIEDPQFSAFFQKAEGTPTQSAGSARRAEIAEAVKWLLSDLHRS